LKAGAVPFSESPYSLGIGGKMIMSKKKSLLGVFFLLVAAAALVCSASTFAVAEQVEINGTVFASEWDANDNVVVVVIATEDGEEITVANSGKGMELLKLEAVNVKATGIIITDENARKIITISHYTVQK
jgi:ABC-type glycerol-3-phosphate transport system substrate-binding protein